MAVNKEAYQQIKKELDSRQVALVAVSKTKPAGDIMELYELGHRDFGENYVQEMAEKAKILPTDIHWHFIGHLQRNKVKYIASFVHMVHGVDSNKLLDEINRQASKDARVINCLLQVHIASEETKFGFDKDELERLIQVIPSPMQLNQLANVNVCGLMGMASFTDDTAKIRMEFRGLKGLFDKYTAQGRNFQILSMGMSSDYKIAVEEGANMVRIGSLLFGEREKKA